MNLLLFKKLNPTTHLMWVKNITKISFELKRKSTTQTKLKFQNPKELPIPHFPTSKTKIRLKGANKQ